MRHFRTISTVKASAFNPFTDFTFRVLRSFEDFKFGLKTSPGVLLGNPFSDGISTISPGDGGTTGGGTGGGIGGNN